MRGPELLLHPLRDYRIPLRVGAPIDDLLETTLIEPLRGLVGRPSKHLRARLVEWSYRAARGAEPVDETRWKLGAQLLEAIHAGSLIVDDIEDDSLVRRGEPTLHRRHGLAIALNAGNWLYFGPLERVAAWNLPPAQELALYRSYAAALARAHGGQALDVGVDIARLPRERVPGVCLASLELKTGALTALAIQFGAILSGASPAWIRQAEDFGLQFGVALQMLDDIGNACAPADDPKRLEDLRLHRPSWLWAVAAETLSETRYADFLAAVEALPQAEMLLELLDNDGLLTAATARAEAFLDAAWAAFPEGLPHAAELRELVDTLKRSYAHPGT